MKRVWWVASRPKEAGPGTGDSEPVEDLHDRGTRFSIVGGNVVLERLLNGSRRDEDDAFYLEVDKGVETFVSRDSPPDAEER